MNFLFLIFISFFLLQTQVISDDFSSIKGCFCEGGLIIGKVKKDDKILIDGINQKISDDGYFSYAFGRKYKDSIKLTINKKTKKITIKKKKYKIEIINNLPKNKVSPNKKELEKILFEQRKIKLAKQNTVNKKLFENNFSIPSKGRISGIFGSQRILNKTPKRPHYGIDIAAPEGTPIFAPSDGNIQLVAKNMFYTGNTIIIDHGLGIISIFAHLSEVLVKEKTFVKKGNIIGKIGKTGRATGPHLHWGVYKSNRPIDPYSLVNFDLN
tara:strand:- start:25 stop:828 length:804 start_codon:yes stop_codon:yes gene_type:complete